MTDNSIRLNNYIKDNYDKILSISKNITFKYKIEDLEHSLISDSIIKLHEKLNETNSYLVDNESFMKYITTYMKNHCSWEWMRAKDTKKGNSLFSYNVVKKCKENKDEDEQEHINDEQDQLIDDIAVDEIYIQAENTNLITKLYLLDMLSNDIPIDRGLIYNDIIDYIKTLSIEEQLIFDLYFIQDINAKGIQEMLSSKTEVSYNHILKIVRSLKQKLKTKFKK